MPGTIAWQDCPDGHAATRYGTLKVYENRTARNGWIIDIYLEVYEAKSPNPAPDGYDLINLFGHSYGATAAQYYLRQYDDHVRSVVLSGGTLLDIPVFEM